MQISIAPLNPMALHYCTPAKELSACLRRNAAKTSHQWTIFPPYNSSSGFKPKSCPKYILKAAHKVCHWLIFKPFFKAYIFTKALQFIVTWNETSFYFLLAPTHNFGQKYTCNKKSISMCDTVDSPSLCPSAQGNGTVSMMCLKVGRNWVLIKVSDGKQWLASSTWWTTVWKLP